jgi:hypothetical protein
VDEEIVLRAAAEAGVEPEIVANAEARRSFIDRALGAMGTNLDGMTLAVTGAGGLALPELPVSDELRDLIRAARRDLAESGVVDETLVTIHTNWIMAIRRPRVCSPDGDSRELRLLNAPRCSNLHFWLLGEPQRRP